MSKKQVEGATFKWVHNAPNNKLEGEFTLEKGATKEDAIAFLQEGFPSVDSNEFEITED